MQELQPGDPRTIGPYRVAARLGVGGMGLVFLARDQEGRDVAVKAVRPELAADAAFRRRFAGEIDALRRVRSPWTAAVVAADADAEPPWLACEYVAGPTLAESLASAGTLGSRAWDELATGLGRALVAVHAAGLIHRDLKPSNVLLSPQGPRVVDFGIAKLIDAAPTTVAGLVVGSAGWLSPEQLRGEPLTPALDLYAAGLLLALAGTGRPAFGDQPAATAFRSLHGEPDLDGLDARQRAIVAALLRADPLDRPDAQGLVALAAPSGPPGEAGTAVLAGATAVLASPTAALAGPPGGRRRPALVAAGATLIVAAVVALALVLTRGAGSPQADPAPSAPVTTAPVTSAPASPAPITGPGTADAVLGHAGDQLRSAAAGLTAATDTLSGARAGVAPALQQVRTAVATLAGRAARTPGDCAALIPLADEARNAVVSLTSNTGAALRNAAGAVQQAAGTADSAGSAVQAAAGTTNPGLAVTAAAQQSKAARAEAVQALAEQTAAESTAAGLLAQAQPSVGSCR